VGTKKAEKLYQRGCFKAKKRPDRKGIERKSEGRGGTKAGGSHREEGKETGSRSKGEKEKYERKGLATGARRGKNVPKKSYRAEKNMFSNTREEAKKGGIACVP